MHAEMLVGLSAVVIGVCALAVSLYETSLMRQEQRAAVIPILELGRSFSYNPDATADEWRFRLVAQNVGIGPARVRNVVVRVDDQPVATWQDAVRALLDSDGPVAYKQSVINGRTIPPDRVVTMFDLSDTEFVPAIVDSFDRVVFEACYCSVFDECWTASNTAFGTATPVESCGQSETSFQE